MMNNFGRWPLFILFSQFFVFDRVPIWAAVSFFLVVSVNGKSLLLLKPAAQRISNKIRKSMDIK